MSKFNTTAARAKNTATSAVTSTAVGTNHQGGAGVARDLKSEIFLFAASNFVGEDTFYENAKSRDDRFARLSREVALADLDWTTRLVRWLRSEANMRSASAVLALEGAKALNDANLPGGRQLVAAALLRADEPGEALAYWFSKYGRKLPKSVKRGIADGARGLYNQYSLGKYDGASKGFRFGDVIELTHPSPVDAQQSALFKFALDRRRDSAAAVPGDSLTMLKARAELLAKSPDEKRALLESGDLADALKASGLTWEALSGSLAGGMDAKAWEAVIPSMGYMALIRNLRNFDQAGISKDARKYVAEHLADPEKVARSRQLPFRFFSAYRATPSDYWKPVLDEALELALANVPKLDGDTEYLIDTSGSMGMPFSARGSVTYAQAASLFAISFAVANGAKRVWGFDTVAKEFVLREGAGALTEVERFQHLVTGGATYTSRAVQTVLADRAAKGLGAPKRFIILSDEQVSETPVRSMYRTETAPALPELVPAETMLYTFNLGGYSYGHAESGMPNRHTFTGLNDSAFKSIALIERGRTADWPF